MRSRTGLPAWANVASFRWLLFILVHFFPDGIPESVIAFFGL